MLIGFIAARTRSTSPRGHPALGAAEVAAAAGQPVGTADDLVHRLAAAPPRDVEAVADLDALDGLDAHEGAGQPGVDPPVAVHVAAEARRQAVREHLDDAAERVALALRGVDLRDEPVAGGGVEDADRARVDGSEVGGGGQRRALDDLAADAHDVREHLDAVRLAQERLGDRAQGDPRGRLPGAGPLEHGTGVVEAVLLHADEVGVTGAGAGQRRVAGEPGEHLGVDGVGRHDRLPLGPLGVADPHGDRPALRQPVPHPAEELDVVALEGHPRAPAVTEPAAGQLVGERVRGRGHAGGEPLEHRHEGGAVGLPGGQPAQHAASLSGALVDARQPACSCRVEPTASARVTVPVRTTATWPLTVSLTCCSAASPLLPKRAPGSTSTVRSPTDHRVVTVPSSAVSMPSSRQVYVGAAGAGAGGVAAFVDVAVGTGFVVAGGTGLDVAVAVAWGAAGAVTTVAGLVGGRWSPRSCRRG